MERVARQGRRFRLEHLEARVCSTDLRCSRVGFIVPKHGHSAVRRNRLRRLLRERTRLALLPALSERSTRAADLVVRVRPTAYQASPAAVRDEFDILLERVVGFLAKGEEQRCR